MKALDGLNDLFQQTSKAPILHFLLFLAVNIIVYVTTLGELTNVLPPRLEWVLNSILPACILGGLITSLISLGKTKEVIPSLEAIKTSGFITLFGLLVLIALYAMSFVIKPTKYITADEFAKAGLNESQILQIQEILKSQGYVSINDLNSINLTVEQKIAINKMLHDLGYVTQGDVEEISKNTAQTQIALVSTQTATAKLTSCYITPEDGTGTVAVRILASYKSDYLGAISEGQKLHVIGHNGGRMNQDRWWLVEFGDNDNNKQYGWVASWVVKEINESECIKIERAPGSN